MSRIYDIELTCGCLYSSFGDYCIPCLGDDCKCKEEYYDKEKEDRECNHAWIYENKLILTEPPQRRRICKNCGKKETIRCGIPIPVEDTYLGIVEKFKGEIKK